MVPAATAGAMPAPSTSPLASTTTPTNPIASPVRRRAPICSRNSMNAASAANGTAMLLTIALTPAGARSALHANSRNGSRVLTSPIAMILNQPTAASCPRARHRNGASTNAPSARRTSTSETGPNLGVAILRNRNEPPQIAASNTSSTGVRQSRPRDAKRTRRPPRGVRAGGASSRASTRNVAGSVRYPPANSMPPDSLANSLNMSHLRPCCTKALWHAKLGHFIALRKRRFFKRALRKIEHESGTPEFVADVRRGRARTKPHPRRRAPAPHGQRLEPPDPAAGRTRRLHVVRAGPARPQAHRRGSAPAGQRGAAHGGDRGCLEAAVWAQQQHAVAVGDAVDDLELAVAAIAALRHAAPRGRIESRFIHRTGGLRGRPFRRGLALRGGRVAGARGRIAAGRMVDAGCESVTAGAAQAAAAGRPGRTATAVSGGSVAGMVRAAWRQAAATLRGFLQRFRITATRRGGGHRGRARTHDDGAPADRKRPIGGIVPAIDESHTMALSRLPRTFAQVFRIHGVSRVAAGRSSRVPGGAADRVRRCARAFASVARAAPAREGFVIRDGIRHRPQGSRPIR